MNRYFCRRFSLQDFTAYANQITCQIVSYVKNSKRSIKERIYKNSHFLYNNTRKCEFIFLLQNAGVFLHCTRTVSDNRFFPGGQLSQCVIGHFGFRQPLKQITQVLVNVQAMGLCHLYHRVYDSTCVCSSGSITEQPVLSFMCLRT